MTRDFLFHFKNEWFRWIRSKKVFLLVMSLSISIAIYSLIVALSLSLNYINKGPIWSKYSDKFITISGKNDIGEFATLSIEDSEIIKSITGAEYTGLVGFENVDVVYKGSQFKVRAAFYSDNLFSMLQSASEDSETRVKSKTSEVLLTPAILETITINDISEIKSLGLGHNGKLSSIGGYLPKEYTSFDSEKIDVWLPIKTRKEFFKVDIVGSEKGMQSSFAELEMLRSMIERQFPFYYVFLDANEKMLHETVVNNLTNEGYTLTNGVTVDANHQKLILNRIKFLFLMSAFIGVGSFFTLSMFAKSEWAMRVQDIRLNLTIGATKKDLYYNLWIEYTPLLIFSLIISCLFIVGQIVLSTNSIIFFELFGDSNLFSNPAVYIVTILSVFLFFHLSFLRLVSILNLSSLFQRSLRSSEIFKTTDTLRVELSLFLVFGGAIGLMLFLFSSALHYITVPQANSNNSETKINVAHQQLNITSRQLILQLESEFGKSLAYSNQPFINPTLETIYLSSHGLEDTEFKIQHLSISEDYFELLGITSDSSPFIENGVFLNKSAKSLIEINHKEVVGKTIYFKGTDISKVIVGFVENAPHKGVSNIDAPAIYSLLSDDRVFDFYVYHDNSFESKKLEGFDQIRVEYTDNILGLVKEYDRISFYLVISSIILAIIIIVMFTSSIRTYVIRDIHRLKRQVAIHIALGGNKSCIITSYQKRIYVLLAISAICSFVVAFTLIFSKFGSDMLQKQTVYSLILGVFVWFVVGVLVYMARFDNKLRESVFKLLCDNSI